ncbi:acyl-protein thioesterase [Homalodisca vitripennis]|nr:acyl-protein thioesterase [Homalodisca vitripennis]
MFTGIQLCLRLPGRAIWVFARSVITSRWWIDPTLHYCFSNPPPPPPSPGCLSASSVCVHYGGALALYSALTFPKKLAGAMALSCWLPLHKSFPAALNAANKETPIFQCHGDCDPIVPYKWGQLTASILKTLVKSTEFRSYRGMMHSSSEEELQDLKSFVEKILPNK